MNAFELLNLVRELKEQMKALEQRIQALEAKPKLGRPRKNG